MLTSTPLSTKSGACPTYTSSFSWNPVLAFHHPIVSINLSLPNFQMKRNSRFCTSSSRRTWYTDLAGLPIITVISGDSYVKTRRRASGISVNIRGTEIDNCFVILYSPYLLMRYQAHINVECTTGFNAIKYIYKVYCSIVLVNLYHSSRIVHLQRTRPCYCRY